MTDADATPGELNVLTDEGIVFDDGTHLAWPECDGTVRRYDRFGRLLEERRPGDEGQAEWLSLFPVDLVEVEFTATFRKTLRLPRERYQLDAELANVAPPEDDCTERVGEITLHSVRRNGRLLPS